MLTDFNVLYYLVYGFTGVLGLTIKPYFFAFHLFEVLMRYPELRNVLKSVWLGKKLLLFTFLLTIILVYAFSLFAYYILNEYYSEGDCYDTWACFLTTFD